MPHQYCRHAFILCLNRNPGKGHETVTEKSLSASGRQDYGYLKANINGRK